MPMWLTALDLALDDRDIDTHRYYALAQLLRRPSRIIAIMYYR